MTLTQEECKEYLLTHLGVLYFAGKQKKIFSDTTSYKEFLNLDSQIKFQCRNALLNEEDIIDEYIASNFDHLSGSQVLMLMNFREKVRGEFIILKCLTHYAIFMNIANNKFYAVKALTDPFTHFFERFPVHVITTLIPFKDKIIYDGFFQAPGIYYGRNITSELNEDYKMAKRNKAIITRLDI